MKLFLTVPTLAVGFAQLSSATLIKMVNNCPYTIWPGIIGNPQPAITADLSVLPPGHSKSVTVDNHWVGGRVWARTGCDFSRYPNGKCDTGDCNSLICSRYGDVPATLFEVAFGAWQNLDFVDISLVNGGNVKMKFTPNDKSCKTIDCKGDFLTHCPAGSILRSKDGSTIVGCNNFCPDHADGCGQNSLGTFFKNACPDAYSYPYDDTTSMFSCPATDWTVTFC